MTREEITNHVVATLGDHAWLTETDYQRPHHTYDFDTDFTTHGISPFDGMVVSLVDLIIFLQKKEEQ